MSSADTTEDTENTNDRQQLARMLSLAGDPTRLEILELMYEWREGCVSSVAEALDTSVATASYHLNLMADNGYFARERDGQTICYRLEDHAVVDCIEKLIEAKL